MIGQLLDGRYRIVRSLGMGGFGQTFVAEDTKQFNKLCVVKQLKPAFTNEATLKIARRLFESEAQLLNRLGDHDQIPRLQAYFELNNEFYLVQDLIEGHDLETEIVPGKKLSESYAIALLANIIEPLAFIHQQNVIHRDIKPANLIRRKQDGKIVLIDFGAVKELTTTQVNAQGQTNLGTIIGTPGYMPSEQGRGSPKLSSDVYATGMIIVQALTGKVPPRGTNTPDELQEDPDTAEILWRNEVNVDPQFAAIIDRMICYDFRQRYRSAIEVKESLIPLIGSVNGSIPAASIPGTMVEDHKTNVQPLAPIAAMSQGLTPPPRPQPSFLKSTFRGFQRFLSVIFILFGVPLGIAMIWDMVKPDNVQEDRDNAAAALLVVCLPMTFGGAWMWFSLNRRIRDEKFNPDWLRQTFYHLLRTENGRVSVLHFAELTQLPGPDAQKYLEARAKEFNGELLRSPQGEVAYQFKT